MFCSFHFEKGISFMEKVLNSGPHPPHAFKTFLNIDQLIDDELMISG